MKGNMICPTDQRMAELITIVKVAATHLQCIRILVEV